MGQQQLLLIVLGTLIIGIAVVVAIIIFNQKSIEVKKDNITSDLLTLASMAQQHFHRPAMLGGGGGSFDDSYGGAEWDVPDVLKDNDNAVYTVESISNNSLTIKAVSSEIVSGSELFEMFIDVTPTAYLLR